MEAIKKFNEDIHVESHVVTTKTGRRQVVRFYEGKCKCCGAWIRKRVKHMPRYGLYCSSECRSKNLLVEYGHDRWYFDAYTESMRELMDGSGEYAGKGLPVNPTRGKLRKNPSKKVSMS